MKFVFVFFFMISISNFLLLSHLTLKSKYVDHESSILYKVYQNLSLRANLQRFCLLTKSSAKFILKKLLFCTKDHSNIMRSTHWSNVFVTAQDLFGLLVRFDYRQKRTKYFGEQILLSHVKVKMSNSKVIKSLG